MYGFFMKGRCYFGKKARLPFIKSIVGYIAWYLVGKGQTFDRFLKSSKSKLYIYSNSKVYKILYSHTRTSADQQTRIFLIK